MLLATLVWLAVNALLAVVLSGPPPSAAVAGAFVGELLVPALFAALVTWVIARRRPDTWPFWQLVVLALPAFVVLRLLFVVSRGA